MTGKYGFVLVIVSAALLAACAVYTAGPAGSEGYGYQAAPPVASAPPMAASPPPAPPEAVVTVAPEFLLFMPSFRAYFLPNVSLDIFFYGDRWYYRSGGYWYWGTSYSGPWTWIEPRRVPGPVLKIPPGYRGGEPTYRRVPYGKWEKHGHPNKWKDRWDRD